MNFRNRTPLGIGLWALLLASHAGAQEGPSFKCGEKMKSSVEELICKSPDLAKLDRTLASVYGAALKKADLRTGTLKAEQQGWIKGRDECWKSADAAACVRDSYGQRIVELEALYSLVPATGPVTFNCGKNGVIRATFFQTNPPSINATYQGQHSLMVAVRSGSGMHYKGKNESFWEHQSEATVTWGFGAEPMTCKIKKGTD